MFPYPVPPSLALLPPVSPGPAGLAAVPWVTNYTDVATLVDQGPAAKLPVLVTDAGVGLCESMVIAHYLNNLIGGSLYPSEINKDVVGIGKLVFSVKAFFCH